MNAYAIRHRQVFMPSSINADASWFADQLDIVRVASGKTVRLNVPAAEADALCLELNTCAALLDVGRERNWYGDPL